MTGWGGVVDCVEGGAEEVSVGVEDFEVGWGWGVCCKFIQVGES